MTSPEDQKQIELPQEARDAIAASAREVERAKERATTIVELAATRHQLLLTQIERDLGIRFTPEPGPPRSGVNRPRPIPPEVEENLRKRRQAPAEQPAEPETNNDGQPAQGTQVA